MKSKKLYIGLFFLLLVINCNTTDKKNNLESKIEITGTIKKIKAGAVGTFSQYTFFVLEANNKSDTLLKLNKHTILFNKEDNVSRGFDEYINKKVKIIGKEIIGFIGWRKKAKPGILVEKIEIIKK